MLHKWLVPVIVCWLQLGVLLSLLLPQTPPREAPGAGRLAEIRRKAASLQGVNVTAQRAIDYSRIFLARAAQAEDAAQPFKADRFAEAADGLLHIAEHQQHLRPGGGPKGSPAPGSMANRLQRVYFRTQQADYFQSQAHEAQTSSFPKWARDFYQLATRAFEGGDEIAADENAKCSEEVVNALEKLAQASTATPLRAPAARIRKPAPKGLL